MSCDFCGGRSQCSSLGVCSSCVTQLRNGYGSAARVAELERALADVQRALAEERAALLDWRQRARAETERADELARDVVELEEACERVSAALEGIS